MRISVKTAKAFLPQNLALLHVATKWCFPQVKAVVDVMLEAENVMEKEAIAIATSFPHQFVPF